MRPPTADDPRTAAQRRGDALVELARQQLSRGTLPTVGGIRPHLGVLVTPAMLIGTPPTPGRITGLITSPGPGTAAGADPAGHPLLGDAQLGDAQLCDAPPGNGAIGIGPPGSGSPGIATSGSGPPGDRLSLLGLPPLPEPAWLNWIGAIPAELAQRLACDADVWRAVLDPVTGLPLDVGREQRLVPHWMRKALHARDRGCRWPGCDAPAAWSDAHHLLAWALGGETNIDNLLLLCRYHHVRVHEGHWRIELDRTTGELRVFRPDGRPYELGASQPWTGPGRRGADPALPDAA